MGSVGREHFRLPVQFTKLLVCLRSAETTSERKIEAARHLSQLGNRESYLISKFETGKTAPFEIQGKVKIWGVEFIAGDPDGFAAKSEQDIRLVTGLMYQCVDELAGTRITLSNAPAFYIFIFLPTELL